MQDNPAYLVHHPVTPISSLPLLPPRSLVCVAGRVVEGKQQHDGTSIAPLRRACAAATCALDCLPQRRDPGAEVYGSLRGGPCRREGRVLAPRECLPLAPCAKRRPPSKGGRPSGTTRASESPASASPESEMLRRLPNGGDDDGDVDGDGDGDAHCHHLCHLHHHHQA